MSTLVEQLKAQGDLPDEGLRELLETTDKATADLLKKAARERADASFGKEIYLRALIEWSNVCRNDCLYCGIRRSNRALPRFSLSEDEILQACADAHAAGLRTFVLQGGENPAATRWIAGVIGKIRRAWPDSAITLSLGELPREDYALLRESGADRYLIRHESANPEHYASLHPKEMSLQNRLRCLRDLRELGFQSGMGMMVGSPGQSIGNLIEDLRLIQKFRPEMIGIGPFIPHRDTPLGGHPAGSAELTLRLYAILRLMHPQAMIPTTTALSSISENGRILGILAGANVIMPNFTPRKERNAYQIYPGKSADPIDKIKEELSAAGYYTAPNRGDHINFRTN